MLEIVRHIRPRGTRQTLLLSATLGKKVEKLVDEVMQRPVRISIGAERGEANENVLQIVEVVRGDNAKLDWIKRRLARLAEDGQVIHVSNSEILFVVVYLLLETGYCFCWNKETSCVVTTTIGSFFSFNSN